MTTDGGGVIQWILDGLAALVFMMGTGIVKDTRDANRELRDAHEELAASLPATYARRDDLKDALAELKAQHKIMNAKLDRLIERR